MLTNSEDLPTQPPCRLPARDSLAAIVPLQPMSSTSADSVAVPGASIARRRVFIAILAMLSVIIPCGIAWQLRVPMNTGSSDFASFYAAGKIINSGQGTRLYDWSKQVVVQNAIPTDGRQNGFLPYAHAPFEALPFTLLARLPYSVAVWLWWGFNLTLPYVCIWVLLPLVPFLAARLEQVLISIGLFFPFVVAECQGQDSIITLLLCTLSFVCLTRRQFWMAGTIYKPPLALPLILILAISSKKKVPIVAGFLSSCLLLLFVSVALVGWSGVIEYPKFLAVFAASPNEHYHVLEMPNLRGLYFSIFGSFLPDLTIIRAIQITSSLLFIYVGWLLFRSKLEQREAPLAFSLAIVTTVLVAFHEYGHDLSVMFLPVLLVWNYAGETRPLGAKPNLPMPIVAVMLFGPILTLVVPQIYTVFSIGYLIVLCRQIHMTSNTLPPQRLDVTT